MGDVVRTNIRDNILPLFTKDQMRELNRDEPEGITACYERLSVDDKSDGESNSIANQKNILERYCHEHGYSGIRHYEDDGYSGTNFNRPGFQAMLADIKAGKIARVIVKDMSRLGREHLQVDTYIEIIFPGHDVHFIAVNDGVDSKRGEHEFTAIRNIFNKMYVHDTSKKLKATWQNKGKSGEHLCVRPPYGYKKDPANKKKWIVDEEAAAVVQKIFSLRVSGMGPTQIANWLRGQCIPCPTAYHVSQGRKAPSPIPKNPCRWSPFPVTSILRRMEYLGHTVNFKTEKVSYKSRKVKQNSPDEWMIFENTQEPIIDENTFMIVQNLGQGRVRKTSFGEPPLFSGLLFCSDCGKKLYFQRRQGTPEGKGRFFCSAYLQYSECTAHYIRLDALEEVILRNLREAISYVSRYESDFVREASDANEKERDRELSKVKDELRKAESRITELDNIIKHLYEDNISGKLTDDRFVKLSRDYELEQDDLKSSVEDKRNELKEREKNRMNVKSFIDTAKKYTNLQKLDATVLREFISKIYISERNKETKTREIRIVYNFVGAFDFDSAIEQANNPRIVEKTG
jgi:DNA invertase Pin-like site-specific DNA recombinase